jgi:hypothetical protein
MPTALRSCLFQNNGRLRLLMPALTEELVEGKAALPEYAGQTLRHAFVALEVDEWRKPLRITSISTSVWVFDDKGDIHASIEDRLNELRLADEEVTSQQLSGQVVDLEPRLRQKRLSREQPWRPGLKEMNQIVMAIWRPVHRR